MRLQTESAPNPADRHAAEPRGLGQTARAPMRLRARRTFQSPNHNLLHLSISDFAGRSRSRLVIESFQASLQKSRFFFQAEDGIRDVAVTGVQTCALPI